MSKATKRKHVYQELEDPNFTLLSGQEIAKVEASRGNNLHEVSCASGDRFLASMPSRYRRNVWIKRGDFVVLERITEGVKVQAEIARILYKDHIDQLKRDGSWPSQFESSQEKANKESDSDDLFVNTNRRPGPSEVSDSSDSDSQQSETE